MGIRISCALMALLCSAGIASAAPERAPDLALLPLPANIASSSGAFDVSASTQLVIPDDADAAQVAQYLGDLLMQTRGFRPQIVRSTNQSPVKNAIQFTLLKSTATPESYQLNVSSQGISLSAGDRAGMFYGAITLWQLLSMESAPAEEVRVPGVTISDQPRLRWRGLTLDSARQFQSVEFVKRFIDAMALHKLNVLQWHLADDQAWRVESRRFPQLTAVNGIGTRFYTRQQIADIVAHAAQRNVTIVPSFGMPSHAGAMIAAYPQLAAGPNARDLLNADDATFVVIGDLLSEFATLFPGNVINLGSAEFPFERWRSAPRVQARMAELGFTSEYQLLDYFAKRVTTLGAQRQRQVIGWDQFGDGSAPVMSSRGLDGALAAVAAGNDTIVSSPLLSLNRRQISYGDETIGMDPSLTLADVYAFDPAPAALPSEDLRRLMGIQANVWTDVARTEQDTELLAFPRAAAVAEIGWTPSQRQGWAGFVNRLAPQMRRYERLGIRYSDALFRVAIIPRGANSNRVGIELSRQASTGEIRYTVNGSEPNARSPVYRDIIEVKAPATIKAATFVGSIPLTTTATLQVDAATLASASR